MINIGFRIWDLGNVESLRDSFIKMQDYKLTRKMNMKRVVLRVKDGVVCVSAHPRVAKHIIDEFVQSKANWIEKQMARPVVNRPVMKLFSDEECLEKFEAIAEGVYPLVASKIRLKPKIFVKDYKSRWGVCYTKRGYIILNKQLFDKRHEQIEYVILHEYVHFLVPNHGVKFHQIMESLMPDYLERRKMLRHVDEG